MCEWGTTVDLRVPISAKKSYTGEFRWDTKPIDKCLAPLIESLIEQGIYTDECCCGHGKIDGYIAFHDGRIWALPLDSENTFILPFENKVLWDEWRDCRKA